MAKPQQPELRRSGTAPALDPDAAEADLRAHRRPGASGAGGPVPDEQQPGHHPEHEQDKPDLDEFAERLGIVAEEDEPADAPHVEDDRPGQSASRLRRTERDRASVATSTAVGRSRMRWSPIGLALVGPVTGILVARGVIRRVKRLRRH